MVNNEDYNNLAIQIKNDIDGLQLIQDDQKLRLKELKADAAAACELLASEDVINFRPGRHGG